MKVVNVVKVVFYNLPILESKIQEYYWILARKFKFDDLPDFVKIQFLDTVYSTYLKWLKGTIGHRWIARHHKHIPLCGSACLKSYFWILNFAINFMKTYLILHATQLGLIVECPHKCIHLYWKRENKKVSKGEKSF